MAKLYVYESEAIVSEATPLLFKGTISTAAYHGPDIDPLFKESLSAWIGKEVRWRHQEHEALLIGIVRSVNQHGGNYVALMEIYSDHKIQKEIQEFIRQAQAENRPLGLSTNFIVVSDKGKPKTIYPREVSVTPSPKCADCRIISIQNEDELLDVIQVTAEDIQKEAAFYISANWDRLKVEAMINDGTLERMIFDEKVERYNRQKELAAHKLEGV